MTSRQEEPALTSRQEKSALTSRQEKPALTSRQAKPASMTRQRLHRQLRKNLQRQLGNIYIDNPAKSTSTTRQRLKPGSVTSSTSTTQQSVTSTSRQRSRHELRVPFLQQVKTFRMTLRVIQKLGGYCRGYGTRVPARRINEAHQEEAQQADSTVRLGQGLTFPTHR